MSDPLSITAGVIAIVTVTIQSTTALYRTMERAKSNGLWDLDCKPVEVPGLQAHKQEAYMDPLVPSSLPYWLPGAALRILNGSAGP
ncbi:hypothetical protein S40288_11648 [Stachybotrys chartarum IBT 40288]|nr:hypothetical protein S40288_11648 [Stachybotrys chartarum IBT 40288]